MWCHDSSNQQRPQLCVQWLHGSMAWLRLPWAGQCRAVSAQLQPGGPADRPQGCVLVSKGVMKKDLAARQEYTAVKRLHKFGCEAIRQPQLFFCSWGPTTTSSSNLHLLSGTAFWHTLFPFLLMRVFFLLRPKGSTFSETLITEIK